MYKCTYQICPQDTNIHWHWHLCHKHMSILVPREKCILCCIVFNNTIQIYVPDIYQVILGDTLMNAPTKYVVRTQMYI